METSKKIRFDYKWVIVTICAIMVMVGLGFCSSANSMYIKPITEALGISRSSYALAYSARYVTTAVVNVFFGLLIYKLGAKLLILSGLISLISSQLIYSFASNVILFAAGSILLGVGLSFTTTAMVGVVVNRWWGGKKGTVMGFILASNGVGAVIARLILTPIIKSETNPFSYQNAYRLVAIILACVALMMLLLFRNDPKGEEHVRIKKEKRKATAEEKSALKRPYFFVALVCIFLSGVVLQGVTGIADPFLNDCGLDIGFITAVLSIHSIVLSVAKFGTGFIYDKFGVRVSSLICYSSAILSMLLITFASMSTFGKICTAVYSILSSFGLPLETIMLPIFAREFFGEKNFNYALGIFVSVNTAGYAVGGQLANLCFDIFGTYKPWIYASAAVLLCILVAMQLSLSAAKKERASASVSEAETSVK